MLDSAQEFIPGDDTRGLVCRELPESEADGLMLRITNSRTGTEYWFDLTPP